MSNSSALPPGAALTVALLVLLGSALTMVGGIGLLRLKTFYSRAHAPTMGSSGGLACITAAGIDPATRPEDLTPEQFVALAQVVAGE